jgi:hypothetical protein
MSESTPIVCTLTAKQLAARATNWRDVVRSSVTHVQERPDGFALTLDYETIPFENIRSLVEAERQCCRWMDLQFDGATMTVLRITSDSHEGKAAIKRMLAI